MLKRADILILFLFFMFDRIEYCREQMLYKLLFFVFVQAERHFVGI